jgi:hypothetical protein
MGVPEVRRDGSFVDPVLEAERRKKNRAAWQKLQDKMWPKKPAELTA